MTDTTLILGGPGCGKTTRLLRIVEEELERGVPAAAIAFVAYTTAAATVAKERAAERFTLEPKRDLPWFRTIHSLAYQMLGVSRDEVMQRDDWKAFGRKIGEPITGFRYDLDDETGSGAVANGDRMMQIADLARVTGLSLKAAWEQIDPEGIDWWALERFALGAEQYKTNIGKLDFTDMLTQYAVRAKEDQRMRPPVRVAVVDEAQDLTSAQWAVVDAAFSGVERLYIAGDDDQAIYHWAGADVSRFLTLKARREVLPVSYRLPVTVFQHAQKVAQRITKRYPKDFTPSDRKGTITWHQQPEHVSLLDPGTWLLLARNGYMIHIWKTLAHTQGVPYLTRHGSSVNPDHVAAMYGWEALRKMKPVTGTVAAKVWAVLGFPKAKEPKWNAGTAYTRAAFPMGTPWDQLWHVALVGIPDLTRTYYISCLRNKEDLRAVPRVRLETIHGVKGDEADNVALLTDMSTRTARSYDADPDQEHRVFYVGMTRTRSTLHLIAPQSVRFYSL